jgi:flagellar basal body-associated protein FliL
MLRLILATIIIVMIFLMVYFFFFDDSLSGEKAAPFNVPEKENILSVTVQDGEGMHIYTEGNRTLVIKL